MKEIQDKINKVFTQVFGKTPLRERIDDVFREAIELYRYTSTEKLKEETGDLLNSLLQLCNEQGWNAEDLVNENLVKVLRRAQQYKALGRKYQIAILGGAFNPVTRGHTQNAKYVLNTSGLFDEVWLAPAAKHLYNKKMESFEDRFNMCTLASMDDGRIKTFDYEFRNGLAGETYHFIKKLMDDPDYENYNFSFIIGLDNANTFDKWQNFKELERMIRFVIVPRVGYEPIPGAWYYKQPHVFLNGKGEEIPMQISSTDIRKNLSIYYQSEFHSFEIQKYLINALGEKVFSYIEERELYKHQ